MFSSPLLPEVRKTGKTRRPSGTHPPSQPYSLKCEGAPKELLGSSEVGLFGWWTAEKEELVWSVHELQLLPCKGIIIDAMSAFYQLRDHPRYPISIEEFYTNDWFKTYILF